MIGIQILTTEKTKKNRLVDTWINLYGKILCKNQDTANISEEMAAEGSKLHFRFDKGQRTFQAFQKKHWYLYNLFGILAQLLQI